MTDWAPVDACTLPTAERPLRVAEFDRLFHDHLTGVVSEPGRAVLTLVGDEGLPSRLADLTARETECCSFFAFHLAHDGNVVWLIVEVPPERHHVLDALVRRARS